MRNLILTIALVCGLVFTSQAQNAKGDWYVGTGDIANIAWTDWAINPTIGYAVHDNLMVGASVSQANEEADLDMDFHARYFWNGYFGYVATDGLSTDGMLLGAGKMFTLRKGVYVDPKVVYNSGDKTTNLQLGFGLTF
tara:strand:- start:3079 stop:3492 length:414 start_codon:yes stop_codon:yes gene_type:complete